jgi:hypothetical protein
VKKALTPVTFMHLFPEFRASSWNGWRTHLARITPTTRELYAVAGRGSGKSRIVSLLSGCFAVRTYRRVPGEFIFIGVFAPDRKQARITFRYIVGLLKSVPALAALIVREGREFLELSNGVIVEVLTASTSAPRGRSYALVIIEEAAFLPADDSANPDVELLRAVRPALARVPGSLLAVVSSPYARRGVLYQAWQKYHDTPDPSVVFIQADTATLNPTFDAQAIATAYEDDPASASAEYGAQFRADVESFISRDVLDTAVVPGRFELPYRSDATYAAFVDPSGGRADSFTLAIAHREQDRAILDVVRETTPPFSPEQVIADYAALVANYGLTTVTGDRYAGEFPREQFRKHGITYEPSEKAKSDIYKDVLPLLNSKTCDLLDHPRLVTQLGGLERRTARGGRDSIDHAPGSRDDVCNAACGALVLVGVREPQRIALSDDIGTTQEDYDAEIRRRNRVFADAIRAKGSHLLGE